MVALGWAEGREPQLGIGHSILAGEGSRRSSADSVGTGISRGPRMERCLETSRRRASETGLVIASSQTLAAFPAQLPCSNCAIARGSRSRSAVNLSPDPLRI